MAIDKAFVISTPSNKASTWSELFGGDDISAVDKPISDYSALDALRYYATDREVVRDPSGINTKPVEGIPGSSYILGYCLFLIYPRLKPVFRILEFIVNSLKKNF